LLNSSYGAIENRSYKKFLNTSQLTKNSLNRQSETYKRFIEQMEVARLKRRDIYREAMINQKKEIREVRVDLETKYKVIAEKCKRRLCVIGI
jgi:hypothetical protein